MAGLENLLSANRKAHVHLYLTPLYLLTLLETLVFINILYKIANCNCFFNILMNMFVDPNLENVPIFLFKSRFSNTPRICILNRTQTHQSTSQSKLKIPRLLIIIRILLHIKNDIMNECILPSAHSAPFVKLIQTQGIFMNANYRDLQCALSPSPVNVFTSW